MIRHGRYQNMIAATVAVERAGVVRTPGEIGALGRAATRDHNQMAPTVSPRRTVSV
jgi:hypothetical protein